MSTRSYDMSEIPPPFQPKRGKEIAKVIEFEDTLFQTYTWHALDTVPYRGRVFIIHGFREIYPVWLPFIDSMIGNGYDVFYFDQRGEGKTVLKDGSKGYPYEEFVFKSTTFLIDYNLKEMEKEGKDTKKFNMLGFSRGGVLWSPGWV
ncbi:unnamed protein product [Ambrosiozyma monospora]|uniref:Unnamed protein product n=1 Tax=Ambrosiozyma monospora TaxID=43982 RepID=A0ACB5UCC7_AMBMO|nr:unnamed protein product [Ambrosiozyma monospora]